MTTLSRLLGTVASVAFLFAAMLSCADAQILTSRHSPSGYRQPCASVTPQTCAIANSLGRGINLGNMLDAPVEGQWGAKLEPEYIDKATALFTTVRLPVRWTNHAALTADATLDPEFAKRVDRAVDALLAKGVYVILDLHHYHQIFGDSLNSQEKAVDPEVVDVRLVNLWRQLALRYQDRSPKLLFELLNEPHDRLNGEAWNTLVPRVLAAVRASNPSRTVLIGPGEWNSINELPKLRLPRDPNLIVAIHNYDPFPFTHQGVEWRENPFPVGTTCCDAAQRKKVSQALDAAVKWSRSTGYPLHLGEFGTYDKADMQSRANYARMVRDEAERRGIGWAYWGFASDFGIYSTKTGQWLEPIKRALLD